MVIWPVVLVSLAAGWIGAAGLGARGLGRLLLTLPLAVGLWLCWDFLLSQVLPAPAAALCGALAALLFALWLRRAPVRSVHLRLPWPLWLLAVLAATAAWLSSVGGCQLTPSRGFLLFELPYIAAGASGPHPLGPEASGGVTTFAAAAGGLGGDPWRTALILAGLAKVAMVLGWLLLLVRNNRSAPLASALAALALWLGSPNGWLVSEPLWTGAAHLLAVVALWLWATRGPRVAAPALLALATLWPQLALALAVPMALPLPRHPLVVLLALLSGLWQEGMTLSLLAALYLWWTHPKKIVRALACAEFVLPGVFGLAALGMALGRAVHANWRRYAGERFSLSWRPLFALRVPRRWLLGLAAALALWLALAPGEEAFNDRVLISAQKQRVGLPQLAWPGALAEWAAWRGEAVGFSPADMVAAQTLKQLQGPVLYLTGEGQERAEVAALVSSLAGGRALAGWYVGADGEGLLPAAAATSGTGRDDLLGATPVRWLLRRAARPVQVRPAAELGTGQARPLRSERWGSLQQYQSQEATHFSVTRDNRAFGADFGVAAPAGLVPFQLPDLSGQFRLSWPNGARDLYRVPVSLPLEAGLGIGPDVPSRSLLALTVTLTNTSGTTLDLDDLTGARLTLHSTTGKPDKPAPITSQTGVVLRAGESRPLSVHLRTPPDPDSVEVSLELLDARGLPHRVPTTSPSLLRCWTRRPPLTVPDGEVRHP